MQEACTERPVTDPTAQPQAGEPSEYRRLPAVDSLLRRPETAALAAEHGKGPVTAAARMELELARRAIGEGKGLPFADEWSERISRRVLADAAPSLRPLINAAGVLIHTNLGRVPLSEAAQRAVLELAQGYSTLEYDLDDGGRGSRHSHPTRILTELTGAEDALVVNNNAAAVFLALSALCQGREVVVSRGELVEIGGGFRIPDVMRQSGAILVEVGTTNRTHARDFAGALTERTAAVMRIHASNFKQVGFVKSVGLDRLVAMARARRQTAGAGAAGPQDGAGPVVIDDLGSGTLLDTARYGLASEPMVQESVGAGADLVTFSGDKLLGGPQAGLIVGRAEFVSRLRSHPLARALRVDKMTLAALDATLRAYRRERAESEIPVWRMIARPAAEIAQRAESMRVQLEASGCAASVVRGESTVGGGSLPGETLPTSLVALRAARPDAAAARLRQADPPVVCRIQKDRLLLDLRTVLPEQERALLEALRRLPTQPEPPAGQGRR